MSDTNAPSQERQRLARAKALFLDAIELGTADRHAFVDAHCNGDEPLRKLVHELLAGEDMPLPAESLAEDIQAAATAAADLATGDPRARMIGRYRLIERIGEGGFGVVYEAEQTGSLKRRVALKLIKLGMDTRQVVARFEAERQALALMEHPSIATVFDGGATETGRPYFVMELVRGKAITLYCDHHKLDIRARLHLFVQVCDAVQHAHSKGIIHRDLKPNNVLVTEANGRAIPKIIDFGIAKATSGTLTDRTVYTQARQMIGTPEYMSPEQANGSSIDIDTRSDVYSLGVILYELLAGVTPIDGDRLRAAPYGEAQRIIAEEDPPSLSTKLSKQTGTIEAIAASRQSDPRKLATALRGELDWIAMKAMEKDRERRYDSASSLAADVARYLAGEAVHAVPPSRLYQARKFVRRNWIMVTAASFAAAALLIGAAGFAWQARSARIERDAALAERARAESTIEFMLSVLRSGNPNSSVGGDSVTVLQAMDTAIADLNAGRFAADADTDARLRTAIADVIQHYAGDKDVRALRQQAVDALRRKYPQGHHSLATALSSLAYRHYVDREYETGEQIAQQAVAMLERLGMDDSEEMIGALNTKAVVRHSATPEERIADFQRIYEMHRRRHPEDNQEVIPMMWNLGRSLARANRYEKGDRVLTEAVDMGRRLRPESLEMLSNSLGILSIHKHDWGKYAEAEQLAEESLEIYTRVVKTPTVHRANKLLELARPKLMMGKPAEAEAACNQALEYLPTSEQARIASALNVRARSRHALGRFTEARADFDESVAITRRLGSRAESSLPEFLYHSALAHLDHRETTPAAAQLHEASEIANRTTSPSHPLRVQIQDALTKSAAEPPYPGDPRPTRSTATPAPQSSARPDEPPTGL